MNRWPKSNRVLVYEVGKSSLSEPMPGTVGHRLFRNPDEAWVRLDRRLGGKEESLHPFPTDDPRGRDVLTHVSMCGPLKDQVTP